MNVSLRYHENKRKIQCGPFLSGCLSLLHLVWEFVLFPFLLGDFGAEYSSMRIHPLPFAMRVAKLSPVSVLPSVCMSGLTCGSTSASLSGLTFVSVTQAGIGSVFTGVDAW